MKIYSFQEGFAETIKEARECTFISNDYATGTSAYVTNIYRSSTYEYKVVDNIDTGFFYSVEKTPLQQA